MACGYGPNNMLLVKKIPANTDKNLLRLFFENETKTRGARIEHIEFSDDERAIIFYEDSSVAERVASQKSVTYKATQLMLEAIPSPWDQKTVLVVGPSNIMTEETLEQVFHSRNGGGPIDSIQLTGVECAQITFEDRKDAAAVLRKSEVKWNCETCTVTLPVSCFPSPADKRSICVTGFPPGMQADDLELIYENNEISGGGPVSSVYIQNNGTEAVITFRNLQDAVSVLRKGHTEWGDYKLIATVAIEQYDNGFNENQEVCLQYVDVLDRLIPSVTAGPRSVNGPHERIFISKKQPFMSTTKCYVIIIGGFLLSCLAVALIVTLPRQEHHTTEASIFCSDPQQIPNGHVSTYSEVAVYSCATGYNILGNVTMLCVHGQWTGRLPVCKIEDCHNLTAPTDGSVFFNKTTYRSNAAFSCNTGYTLHGSQVRTCQADGFWSAKPPYCKITDCGKPSVPTDGSLSVNKTTYGSNATYSCNIGYTLSGSPMRTCLSDEKWSGEPPQCKIKDCGKLPAPIDGSVQATRTTYLSKATYSCNTGYTLNGSPMRTCLSDGTWSGEPPQCKIKDCGKLKAPTEGTVKETGTTYRSTATYSCNTGYTLSGNQMRTCQSDGQWSGAPAKCNIKDCGKPKAPMEGSVQLTGTTYGSKATYSCYKGYTLKGNPKRTCQADGQWSGEIPRCMMSGAAVAFKSGYLQVTVLVTSAIAFIML